MVAFQLIKSLGGATKVAHIFRGNEHRNLLANSASAFPIQARHNKNHYDHDYNDKYEESGVHRYERRNTAYAPHKSRYRPRESNIITDLFGNKNQLGIALIAIGMLLTVMGMMLFFEGNLLRLGNISLILGIVMLVGSDKLSSFFFKESRMQATIITFLGVIFVFIGRPRLGLVIEIFGLLSLFGNMFPILMVVGKKIPIVGDILSTIEESIVGSRPPSRRSNRQYNPYPERKYKPEF